MADNTFSYDDMNKLLNFLKFHAPEDDRPSDKLLTKKGRELLTDPFFEFVLDQEKILTELEFLFLMQCLKDHTNHEIKLMEGVIKSKRQTVQLMMQYGLELTHGHLTDIYDKTVSTLEKLTAESN